MKNKLSLLTTAAIVALASQASAQGLLQIGHNLDTDFERKLPFAWTVGAQIGWDSNVNVSATNEQDSLYASLTLGVNYSSGDKRTAINYHATYSPLYYFDSPGGVDDFQHNGRIGFDVRHRVNPRLTISDSFYIAYEVEPDFGIGATVARRTEPYFYGYNSLAAAYSWNRRFSTVTSYTISGVDYDGAGTDYFQHIFANEFRYAFSRTTTGVLTYRYSITDSDAAGADYDSQYLLVGADHRFNPQLTGSVRAGAEFREGDSTPYVETALTYRVSRKTDLRWYAQYGFSTNGIDSGNAGLRTGVTASHRFNSRFTGNLGAHFIQEDNIFADQDVLALSAGFSYALVKNISLNGGYSFTTAFSDNDAFEFDRHQLQLGVGARF